MGLGQHAPGVPKLGLVWAPKRPKFWHLLPAGCGPEEVGMGIGLPRGQGCGGDPGATKPLQTEENGPAALQFVGGLHGPGGGWAGRGVAGVIPGATKPLQAEENEPAALHQFLGGLRGPPPTPQDRAIAPRAHSESGSLIRAYTGSPKRSGSPPQVTIYHNPPDLESTCFHRSGENTPGGSVQAHKPEAHRPDVSRLSPKPEVSPGSSSRRVPVPSAAPAGATSSSRGAPHTTHTTHHTPHTAHHTPCPDVLLREAALILGASIGPANPNSLNQGGSRYV